MNDTAEIFKAVERRTRITNILAPIYKRHHELGQLLDELSEELLGPNPEKKPKKKRKWAAK